jgi:flagellar hook-associated protein 1 FlgK
MSLNGLFDIAKSAIYTNQLALNTITNNIANANTPGYSRQEVILEVANPVQVRGDFVGRGVTSGGVRRHYDKFLQLQIIGQEHSYGRSTALESGLSQIEQIFNEAQGLGIGDILDEYFNAWQDVATNPESQTDRTSLLQKASALVQAVKQMELDIEDTLKYINEDIKNIVTDINAITSEIASLNAKITQVEAGLSAEKASYFRDERDQKLTELAQLMNYSWYENDNGAVTILAGGRSLVNGEVSYSMSTQIDVDGNRQVYLNGEKITSIFSSGTIGGLISSRNDINNTPLHSLRRLIASIIKETNILHRQGYGLDSSTNNDFFDPLKIYTVNYSSGGYVSSASVTDVTQLTLDEYSVEFTSSTAYKVYDKQTGSLITSGTYTDGSPINFEGIRVVIKGSPASGDSFLVSPLKGVIKDFDVSISDTDKVAAASSSSALPGDNRNALSIAGLSQTSISDLGSASFDEYYEGIVSGIGIMSKAAHDSLEYDDNMRYELQKKRDQVSGVSLDEEAADLIRFQRAYEAGARILKITDELMQTIINL